MEYDLACTGNIDHIAYNNGFVVLIGGKLWIFRADGSLVAFKRNIINAYKLLFLSGNRVLVECGRLKAYILLSLEDGKEILRIPQPKMDISARSFTISKDEANIYDYFELSGKRYILQINTSSWEIQTFFLEEGMRSVVDIKCDDRGNLCLLECHYETDSKHRISRNGIRAINQNDAEYQYSWLCEWNHAFPRISYAFLGGLEWIITNDLYIYNAHSKKSFFLLENDNEWQTPKNEPGWIYLTADKKYVILFYSSMNVVVDLNSRKMVARYAARDTQGCLVGDEYWICCDKHITRKSFPLIENVPEDKYVFWNP